MPTKKENSPPETSSSAAKPPAPNAPVYEGFTDVLSTLSTFRSQITVLQNQIRSLEKTVKKNMKANNILFKNFSPKSATKPILFLFCCYN